MAKPTRKQSGVTNTATSVTMGLRDSMNARDSSTVITPDTSWTIPWFSPSEMASMSLVNRLIMSPWEWVS